MKMTARLTAAAMAAGVMIAPSAYAQTSVTNGAYTVGIGTDGELYNNPAGVGFKNNATGADPIKPGSPRDSWGVSTSTSAAYADQNGYGTSGITGTTFTGSGATTTGVSSTTLGLTVAQIYSFAAPNILRIATTVTNTTSSAVSALFQRDVDFDFPAEAFSNFSFNFGSKPANVIDSSYDGFESPNPADGYAASCFAGCNNDGDNGGGIKLNLGSIAAGGSTSFSYYYGIGDNVNDLIASATALGVTYGIAAQSDENGASGVGKESAFIGVGSPIAAAAPEPGTWGMMILGFGAVGFAMRRRHKVMTRVSFAA